VNGRLLTDCINKDHENVKYLPGVRLPANVAAVPDIQAACREATILVFVLPHQFLGKVLPEVKAAALPGAYAISLIKVRVAYSSCVGHIRMSSIRD
jgi:glycerol-3-phosphate dehydrogenase (NAD+)